MQRIGQSGVSALSRRACHVIVCTVVWRREAVMSVAVLGRGAPWVVLISSIGVPTYVALLNIFQCNNQETRPVVRSRSGLPNPSWSFFFFPSHMFHTVPRFLFTVRTCPSGACWTLRPDRDRGCAHMSLHVSTSECLHLVRPTY